ncbi:MAG: ABC transporter ATP-binding protein [Chitinophagales bacterium]
MGNFSRILQYLKHYKVEAILNVFFNLLYILFSVFSIATVIPFIDMLLGETPMIHNRPDFALNIHAIKDTFSYFITKVISHYETKEAGLIFIALFMVFSFFFKNLFRYLAQHFMAPIRNGVVRDIRVRLNKKILSLPLSFYNKKKKGDLIANLTADVVEIENGVLSVLEIIFKEPVMILVFMGILFSISIKLTLFVLFLITIIAVFVGAIGRTLKKPSFKGQQQLGFLTSLYDETIGGMRVIKGFTAEQYKQAHFEKESNVFLKIMNGVLRKRYLSSPLTEFLAITVFSTIIWVGGNEVISGMISTSIFIFYLISFGSIIGPAKNFSSAYYNVNKGLGAVDRINEILDEKDEIIEAENPIEKTNFEHNIVFENVSFAYRNYDNKPIVDKVNLEIKAGNVLALVGPSGAGKTTLADLIPRFYDVQEGEITIDGIDIRKYAKSDLRQLMGIVTQDSILFNDTVKNNIAFGINASEEQIIEAAKIANAHEFITEMANGYNTPIGDRGQNLSGGQRQRLTIARAILKNPPILILDEATSALDSESEKLVQDALIKLMKNRTSIVIAHRLSTIQFADEICVMDEGKIVEKGNHISLIAKNGLYKKLVELQAF